jgi:hypothetical protein
MQDLSELILPIKSWERKMQYVQFLLVDITREVKAKKLRMIRNNALKHLIKTVSSTNWL